ncbi:outer membrane beta-barrel domain-containing protein [Bdellovibrio svalbardensis]|uniref:Outer membrane beta-barrel domain-containing protein n=1 Tax=Bdellovibrio svalbardensis TaxID=2972972 RepID=A0ABT6DHB6_9BACT|nr:outer membrane beta-barrel domain-containing protein [Bdellovibrio svalbardensis]MDG0815645.1 outer membrane beta-barrel domain-containing protein [Bdellovibrio svalbardensis]
MISKATKILLVLALNLFALSSQATVIQFDADELPTESVVPILDSNMAVKNKAIPLAGRLEVGLFTASVIDEMFFNNSLWGFEAFYSFSEDKAWGLKYADRMSGLSSYSDQFQSTSAKPSFSKAPAPSSILTASYRWTFLYGKMSLSKSMVLPTMFATEVDAGANKVGGQSLPYTSFGITHKLFFKKHVGVGLSYRLLLYQTLDPVSVDLGSAAPTPSESDFSKKIQLSQSLDIALSYLF